MFHYQDDSSRLLDFVRKVIIADIAINLVSGTLCVFFPRILNSALFSERALPWWVFLETGAGFFLFATWQIARFIKPKGLTIGNLRFAAVLAWMPILALSAALLSSLGDKLRTISEIFLWTANIYMLLLGGLYWFAGVQVNQNQSSIFSDGKSGD